MKHVKGLKQLLNQLEHRKEVYENAVEEAFRWGVKEIKKRSQKIVPWDTWYLHDTAFTAVEGRGFDTVARAGYTAYYAIYVHENLENKHKPGRTAKFLTIPLHDVRPLVIQRIQNRVKQRKRK